MFFSGRQVISLTSIQLLIGYSTPYSYGIFRLTDPPGLQTILDCRAKEAFHPHSERPIYTVRFLVDYLKERF